MNAGTLKGKECRFCGEIFRRGADNKIKVDYCAKCSVPGWQKEMYDAGCNVEHHTNMGKVARIVKLRIKDCPKIEIKKEVYRDISDLLYEDTRYRKIYLSKKEQKRIKEQEAKRRKIEREQLLERIAGESGMEAERKERERLEYEAELLTHISKHYTDEEDEIIIKMKKAKERTKAIGIELRRAESSINNRMSRLRKAGRL